MYSNNLNNAYEYECERRNDERRAAAESLRLQDLDGRRTLSPSAWIVSVGILAALLVVIRAI